MHYSGMTRSIAIVVKLASEIVCIEPYLGDAIYYGSYHCLKATTYCSACLNIVNTFNLEYMYTDLMHLAPSVYYIKIIL